MTKVIISEDCGNSPKNLFVQEFTIALIKSDLKNVLNRIEEEISWNILGDQMIQGKEEFVEALESRTENPTMELSILHIATHGKTGAADGLIKFKNEKRHAFCNIYEFSNAKGTHIKEIISYIVEI